MTYFEHLAESHLLRVILLTLSLIGIGLFASPLLFRIVNIGNLFGLGVSIALLLTVLLRAPLGRLYDACMERKAGKITLTVIGILLLLCVLYCMILSVLMLHAAHKKPKEAPAAMVVLGCKVRGETPSLMLYRRIKAAYAAMQQYPDMLVIASGGQGNDEDISEAQCIAETLIEMGADRSRILLEDQSTTTSENMRYSRAVLEAQGIPADSVILLASDGYHEMRAQILAGYEGLERCYPAAAYTSWFLAPTYVVREWFGLTHAFVFHS